MKKLFEALIKVGSSSITIDGKTFTGRNIKIINDKVIVDGVEQEDSLVGPVSVTVNGDAERIETVSGSVEVSGSCSAVKTMSGDVRCGDVKGDVGTMSGDVTCGSVSGQIKTMSGDVRMRL